MGAITKEASISRDVRIAIRISKDTDTEWSAKCYLYIHNGFGALLLKKGERRKSADEAMKDGAVLLRTISKEIGKMAKSLCKDMDRDADADTDKDADKEEADGIREDDGAIRVPEGDSKED